jgi:hypothetical protein
LCTSPISKLRAADDERRQAKRAEVAGQYIEEGKVLATLKVEKAAVEGERRTVEADLGPRCGIRRRCLAPRTMTCSGISSSLSRCPASAALPVAHLSAEIMNCLTDTLVLAGPELPDTQPVRRELIRRVIALDPIIDQIDRGIAGIAKGGGLRGGFWLASAGVRAFQQHKSTHN